MPGEPALEAMLAAWPPLEREHLGDWTLRFSGGFTRRANSVLPHGDPGRSLEPAVERCGYQPEHPALAMYRGLGLERVGSYSYLTRA